MATAISNSRSATPRSAPSNTSRRSGSGTSVETEEAGPDRPGVSRQGAGAERLPRPQGRRRLQPAVQRDAAYAAEASAVAPSGKPLRLTEFREELQRLIGKPDGYAEVRIWDVVRPDHAPR